MIYEEGDGADEDYVDNLQKVLSDCPAGGISDGTVVTVEDFTQVHAYMHTCIHTYIHGCNMDIYTYISVHMFLFLYTLCVLGNTYI
jgi:hypothetical protein